MSDNTALSVYSAPTTITTADGKTFTLPPGKGLGSLLPANDSFERMPRLVAGQPNDQRFRAGRNQFFITRRVKNEATGQFETENIGPFGEDTRVIPVGYWLTRAMFNYPFSEGDKPLCGSSDFINPDLRYAGGAVTNPYTGDTVMVSQCCTIRLVTNARGEVTNQQIVEVCPLAKFGPKDPKTGKATRPACSAQYVAGVAVYTGEKYGWMLAELNHKGLSAKDGVRLTRQLEALDQRGIAPFAYWLDILVIEAGQGNSFNSLLRTDESVEFGESDTPEAPSLQTIQDMYSRWQKYVEDRKSSGNSYVPPAESEKFAIGSGSSAPEINVENARPISGAGATVTAEVPPRQKKILV